jgi:ABC-2 type transport system permease protein
VSADAVAARRPRGAPLLPIFNLTLRAFSAGKALRVVALFAITPVLFAAIYAIDAQGTSARSFVNDLFQNLIAPTTMPLAILTLGANALGNELEDRTMVYLVLKPVSRLRIVVEKLLAVFVACLSLLWIGSALAWLVAARGAAGDDLRQLAGIEAGVLTATICYGAIFLAISLLIPRALLAGIMYTLLWETTFGRFIPGVREFSVRQYVVSIYARILGDRQYLPEQPMQLTASIIVVCAVLVVFVAVATWRLKRMNLE